MRQFESNLECAEALFDYLCDKGEFERGDISQFTDILHDINNLRGHEWLEGIERNSETRGFFDFISYKEFTRDEFVWPEAVSPNVFLKVALDEERDHEISFDELRDALDEKGLDNLWDYSLDDIDEAINNLSEDAGLIVVGFYEGDEYYARAFEASEEMAECFWNLFGEHNKIAKFTRRVLEEKDEFEVEEGKDAMEKNSMKVKIYQVDSDKDKNDVKFMRYDSLEKWQGTTEIDSGIYKTVFDGEMDCSSLDGVYSILNTKHPIDYLGHSLSVSDIIEVVDSNKVEPGFYFVDSIGFKKVEFEPEKAAEITGLIDVVLIEPGKEARMAKVGSDLRCMQRAVEGDIEQLCPYEDEMAIICNGEGKMCGMPLNRALYDDDHEIYDIIAGTCFICGARADDENYSSLTADEAKKYLDMFRYPEEFMRGPKGIVAIKIKPKLSEVVKDCEDLSKDGNRKTSGKGMTAIREGYDEFSLYPNEELIGINLTHGGGQVKVNGVLYQLQRPLSMQDAIKLDHIPYEPTRHKVDDYFADWYECR